jgi:hypothetical protein
MIKLQEQKIRTNFFKQPIILITNHCILVPLDSFMTCLHWTSTHVWGNRSIYVCIPNRVINFQKAQQKIITYCSVYKARGYNSKFLWVFDTDPVISCLFGQQTGRTRSLLKKVWWLKQHQNRRSHEVKWVHIHMWIKFSLTSWGEITSHTAIRFIAMLTTAFQWILVGFNRTKSRFRTFGDDSNKPKFDSGGN